MQTTIDLLIEKNNCLEKFFRLNEAELINFSAGNFDHLEDFYAAREGVLEIIKRIDVLLDEENQIHDKVSEVPAEFKRNVLSALDYRNQLVKKILAQDLEILSAIESAKSEIIRELSEVRVTRKAIGSYKSGQTTLRLDEEA